MTPVEPELWPRTHPDQNWGKEGTSLAVQWLEFHTSTAEIGSIPGWGTTSSRAIQHDQKKKKKKKKSGRKRGGKLSVHNK